MKLFFIMLVFSFHAQASQNFCVLPDTAIDIGVDTKVSSKDGIHTYDFSVSNSATNQLPIGMISVDTSTKPIELANPSGWSSKTRSAKNFYRTSWIDFSLKRLTPASTQSGFIIKSKNRPGLIRMRLKGFNREPFILTKVPYKDSSTICPGHWSESSSAMNDPKVSIVTVGPVDEDTISSNVFIRRSSEKELWTGSIKSKTQELLSFSPVEDGNVDLLVLSSDELDVEDIDLSSLTFGRGLARSLKANFVSDLNGGKLVLDSETKSKKNLILTFNLKDINVLCDLDQSLFLEAKTKKGKKLFGATKINRVPCTEENWVKEIPKIKGSDTFKYKN